MLWSSGPDSLERPWSIQFVFCGSVFAASPPGPNDFVKPACKTVAGAAWPLPRHDGALTSAFVISSKLSPQRGFRRPQRVFDPPFGDKNP
jgi:hypothetical protein